MFSSKMGSRKTPTLSCPRSHIWDRTSSICSGMTIWLTLLKLIFLSLYMPSVNDFMIQALVLTLKRKILICVIGCIIVNVKIGCFAKMLSKRGITLQGNQVEKALLGVKVTSEHFWIQIYKRSKEIVQDKKYMAGWSFDPIYGIVGMDGLIQCGEEN